VFVLVALTRFGTNGDSRNCVRAATLDLDSPGRKGEEPKGSMQIRETIFIDPPTSKWRLLVLHLHEGANAIGLCFGLSRNLDNLTAEKRTISKHVIQT